MTDRVAVHRGRYFDSVRLMLASAAAEAAPGVERALVAMGTHLNRSLRAGRTRGLQVHHTPSIRT